jgi:Fe/S biogenesis protein NfuA
MITISESAQTHFGKLLEKQEPDTNIRVFVVSPGTPGAECGVSYCPPDAIEESDTVLEFNGFDAVVDLESAPFLEEAEIDFVTDQMGSQLTLKAPNAKARKVDNDAPLAERVSYMIEAEINPQLASHGGKVTLIEITEAKEAILEFGGGCNGCAQVDVTLKDGIEKQMLEQFVGELTAIKDATEHQAGEHSYY